MMNEFSFTLKGIRSEVDDEEIGFRLYGDKAKPVHFATGLFRGILGERSDTDLLSRLVYVTDAKGRTKPGCEMSKIYEDLRSQNIIENDINLEEIKALRLMMQNLLNADSAVFGEKGNVASYSAASEKFVTSKAMYEEVGEIGAGIIKESCPELSNYIKDILHEDSDEISVLFNPIQCDMEVVGDDVGQLPKWTKSPKNSEAWKNYIDSVKQSGMCLLDNIRNQPKLLAVRTVVHFAIFHLIRYLAKQESFHDPNAPKILPFLSVYTNARRSPLVDSSKFSFLQIGQSMTRFYGTMYSNKMKEYGLTLRDLMSIEKAPMYDEKKKPDAKKTIQNNEVWISAKSDAKEESNEASRLLRLGRSIHDMVVTASDTNPNKYIRGLGLKTGILYPDRPRVTPYFRFSQDITSMLVLSAVHKHERISGNDFLLRLRNYFDLVTGALDGDFVFCSEHIQTMRIDEDELAKNGESFIELICDMGYGTVLADGIFRVAIGD